MLNLEEMIRNEIQNGYSDYNARAKVCQDIVLKAIASGDLNKNITVKLKQQEYKGKRVYIEILDETGFKINSKIDLGVHSKLDVAQEEYCFDIAFDDEGANLLINSNEQMFVEKLRSLLKLGPISTRYKDVFDMFYLSQHIDLAKLKPCMDAYIFNDTEMHENRESDVINRIQRIFSNEVYLKSLSNSNKNWLDESVNQIVEGIIGFLTSLNKR